jgi:hypothetical protein
MVNEFYVAPEKWLPILDTARDERFVSKDA